MKVCWGLLMGCCGDGGGGTLLNIEGMLGPVDGVLWGRGDTLLNIEGMVGPADGVLWGGGGVLY